MTRRRAWAAGTACVVVLAALVGACSKGGSESSTTAVPAARGPASGPDAGGSTGLPPAAVPAAVIGPRIIKTSTIRIAVPDGTFDDRFQDANQVAARHGGFVASSQSARSVHPTGTVVLRVPADQFEATLGELEGMGRVTGEEVSGQDVTAQYVDLQARLRNWEAQETVLLDLMSKSTSIDDSIKVQRSLQDVQLQIEQLRGQLRVLDDQTSYATITVSLRVAGAPVTEPEGTLSRAWHDATEGFVSVVAAVVVGLGYLAPFALVGLFGMIAWRAVRRRDERRSAPEPSV